MNRDYQCVSGWIDWLKHDALPLWLGPGFDQRTGLVFEALDHDGHPLPDLPRRLRVQMRQAYVFAKCAGRFGGRLGNELSERARSLLMNVRTRGFDARTGHLVYTFGSDGQASAIGGELYDLAFLFLACAAAIERGYELGDLVTRAEAALDALKAPSGWYETPDRRLPRRQNPHMHLFEAAIAMAAATGSARYRNIADECLALLATHFLQPGHLLFEFFRDDFGPVPAKEQSLEPGHMAEWVGLLHAYETVFSTPCGIDILALAEATALLSSNARLVLPDQSPMPGSSHRTPASSCATMRLWPQTEWVKCHAALACRGSAKARQELPRLLGSLAATWFNPKVPGGWYDQRSLDGQLLSTMMPASTMYHVYEAILATEKAD